MSEAEEVERPVLIVMRATAKGDITDLEASVKISVEQGDDGTLGNLSLVVLEGGELEIVERTFRLAAEAIERAEPQPVAIQGKAGAFFIDVKPRP